jgi:ribosomal RNA-processing protein 12
VLQISATVTALARLVFEFANRLGEDLPQLLSAVLMLFRQKSREVVKACLGFVKVAVMRLAAWQLEPHVGEILEGVLLWASDTKNRFKLKVANRVPELSYMLSRLNSESLHIQRDP